MNNGSGYGTNIIKIHIAGWMLGTVVKRLLGIFAFHIDKADWNSGYTTSGAALS